MSRKRGFTLITLLVVMAVMAVLSAILFPRICSVNERPVPCIGTDTHCMSQTMPDDDPDMR